MKEKKFEKWYAMPELERRIKHGELTQEEVDAGEGFAYVLGFVDGEVWEEEKRTLSTYVWLTRDTYNKMEYAYKRHFTHAQMRAWSGVNLEKYKKLVRKYPRLLEMEEQWKGFVCSKAKINIAEQVENGDVEVSKWVLEKLERSEYGKPGDNAKSGNNVVLNLEVDMKKVEEMRNLLLGKQDEGERKMISHGEERAEELVVIDRGGNE